MLVYVLVSVEPSHEWSWFGLQSFAVFFVQSRRNFRTSLFFFLKFLNFFEFFLFFVDEFRNIGQKVLNVAPFLKSTEKKCRNLAETFSPPKVHIFKKKKFKNSKIFFFFFKSNIENYIWQMRWRDFRRMARALAWLTLAIFLTSPTLIKQ